MTKRIGLCLGILAVAACGPIRDIEDTKNNVRASVAKIDETKEAQLLGASYEVMISEHHSPNTRAGAAEVVFAKGDRARLPVYVGALHRALPLDAKPAIRWNLPSGSYVDIPNVTIVGTRQDTNNELNVPPVDQDLFDVLVAGVMQSLKKVAETSDLQGHLTADQVDQIRSFGPRLLHIAPTVLGAMTLDNLRAVTRNTGVRGFVVDEAKRKEGRDLLLAIARTLPFSPAQKGDLDALIRVKLGL